MNPALSCGFWDFNEIINFYNDIAGWVWEATYGQFEHETGRIFWLDLSGLNAKELKWGLILRKMMKAVTNDDSDYNLTIFFYAFQSSAGAPPLVELCW